jgi:SpoVK/Ycf46/Vps4 family AAA+-type ATPase
VATANRIAQLRPEQIREGRFGAKIWVPLPSFKSRAEIFAVHLKKRDRNPDAFDLVALADHTERYSGAEIEQAVKSGLLAAFMDDRRPATTDDLLRGAAAISPTAVVNQREIAEMEAFAKEVGAISAEDGSEESVGKTDQKWAVEL